MCFNKSSSGSVSSLDWSRQNVEQDQLLEAPKMTWREVTGSRWETGPGKWQEDAGALGYGRIDWLWQKWDVEDDGEKQEP